MGTAQSAAPQQVHVAGEQLVCTVAGEGGRLPVELDVADPPHGCRASARARCSPAAARSSGTVRAAGARPSAAHRPIAGTGDGGVAPAGRAGVH